MTAAERNPCPTCGKTPSLMAGINVPCGDTKKLYFVCWPDQMWRAWEKGSDWHRFKKAKIAKPEWKKFSGTHWQMAIRGEPLDFWPTKNKWRFRGKTYAFGSVKKFIDEIVRAEE